MAKALLLMSLLMLLDSFSVIFRIGID